MTTKNCTRLFVVYCHTNKLNGYRYIGITCQEPSTRWGYNGNNYKQSQPYFAAAINKYGWNNFTHEILYNGLTVEEAHKKEIELIKKYNTYAYDPDSKGYNLTRGGFGGVKYLTEEARRKATNAKSVLSKQKHILKLKADPEAYKKYMEKECLRNKIYLSNPDNYRKKLDANNKRVAIAKLDPEKKIQINQAKKQVRIDVNDIRKQLKDLFSKDSSLFTPEQYHKIFAFAADHKNYACTSKKQLLQILLEVREIIKQREVENAK